MYKAAITSRYDEEEKKLFLKKTYYEWLKDDFEMYIVTPNNSNDYCQIADYCDVLIITGGDDINPRCYNDEIKACNLENERIEQMDFQLIKYFHRKNKAIVGICRGIQVINVYFGGNLIQEISKYKNAKNHQGDEHDITIEENSLLYHFFQNKIHVNSYHHQCINQIAPYLFINAISEDGFIEGIEYRNIFGVQWHPELMNKKHQEQFIKLIKYLIEMKKYDILI